MNNKQLLLLLFFYMSFAFISLYLLNPHFDEVNCHIPTVNEFCNSNVVSAIKSDNYKSANTPLPYIIVASFHKLIGIEPTLFSVRVFNIIISITTLLLFGKLIGKQNNILFYALVILFFYPYFLKPSFAFFMSIYGLLFYLVFLLKLNDDGAFNKFLVGIAISFAILSQQFYLILLAPYCIKIITEFVRVNDKKRFFKEQFLFLLPLTLVGGLFIIWGGLTHPFFHYHGVEFRIENVTSILILIGSTFFPFALFKIINLNRRLILGFICISLLLCFFAYPIWINMPTIGGISGYTFRMLAFLESINFYLGLFVKSSFTFLGFISIYLIIKNVINKPFLLIIFLFLLIGFTFNSILSERHMLPLIVTGYLIVLPLTEVKLIKYLWLPYQVTTGIIYFIFINFIYKSIY